MHAEELATAYLKYFGSHRDEDRWAWSDVDNLVRRDADRGWEITRILVNKSTSDEALAFVAAGPLEDLLKKHGLDVIDRIENECKENDRLRMALSGVSIGPEKPIFGRWYQLMREYGFVDGKRTGL
jgi:uncharacterized protein DUF6869